MNPEDLLISHRDGVCTIRVRGRANFEYAVPLRELARGAGTELQHLVVEASGCTSMDSTFMGVLSMLGLSAARRHAPAEIAGAPDSVRALLKGLGVDRLFRFTDGTGCEVVDSWQKLTADKKDMLRTAETVYDAHRTLTQVDEENGKRFESVISYAAEDVERLKKEKESGK